MFVSLGADWVHAPASRQEFGLRLTLTLSQYDVDGRCAAWPAPVRFTLDGEEVGPAVPDPVSGCIDLEKVIGPTLEVGETVTVRYETEGRVIATATYHRIAPGLAAILAVPADGQARTGDEIVVVPPPELPTNDAGYPRFYPLDEEQATSWLSDGVRPIEVAKRLPDGIHVKVPRMSGRVAMVVDALAPFKQADVSCEGFASCGGKEASVVGPIYLTVQLP
jgi:hypothetical protein